MAGNGSSKSCCIMIGLPLLAAAITAVAGTIILQAGMKDSIDTEISKGNPPDHLARDLWWKVAAVSVGICGFLTGGGAIACQEAGAVLGGSIGGTIAVGGILGGAVVSLYAELAKHESGLSGSDKELIATLLPAVGAFILTALAACLGSHCYNTSHTFADHQATDQDSTKRKLLDSQQKGPAPGDDRV